MQSNVLSRPETDEDARLVRQLSQDDQQAFEQLIARYHVPLRRYVTRTVVRVDITEEILWRTWWRVWVRRRTLRPDGLKAYLYKLAGNLAVDHLRRAHARGDRERAWVVAHLTLTEGHDREPTTPDLAARAELAISQLPARQREAFMLTQLQGYSHRRAAEILGVSTKTVENHVARARKALRQKLLPE